MNYCSAVFETFSQQHPGIYTTHQRVTTWDQEQLYTSRLCQGQVLVYASAVLSMRLREFLAHSTAIYSWLFKTQALHFPLLFPLRPLLSPLFVLKMEEVWGCKVSSRRSSETQDWGPVAISHPQPCCTSTSHRAGGTKEFRSKNCFFTLHPEKRSRWCWCQHPHQARHKGCEKHLSSILNPGSQLWLLSEHWGLRQESVLQVSTLEDIRLQTETMSCMEEIKKQEQLS